MEVDTLIDPPDVNEPAQAVPEEPSQPSKKSRKGKSRIKPLDDDSGEEAANPATFRKLERPLGTTNLPLARIQKIMKADKDLGNVSKEAVFIAAVATVRNYGYRLSYLILI